MFEAAQAFKKGEYIPSTPDEVLPVHVNLIAGAIAGGNAKELFFKAKGVIEGMHSYCHFEEPAFSRDLKPSWADDKVWLNITYDGQVIGSFGLLSVSALADSGIRSINAAAFELETDLIRPYPSRTNKFRHLPQYPLVEQDLSLVVDEGKKSVMLSLKIGNDDSTMTSKQIEKKMAAIIKVLGKKVGAELR